MFRDRCGRQFVLHPPMACDYKPLAAGRDFQEELLPVAIDNIASIEPDRPFALIARDADLAGGLQEVTFGALARAIDRAAWWLEDNVGKPLRFPTITYIGSGDLRYYVLLAGAMKVGFKVRANRERSRNSSWVNPQASILHLMRAARSEVFIYSTDQPLACAIAGKCGTRTMEAPSVAYLFDEHGEAERHYFYEKTPAAAGSDPVMIFNSSGTTGFPKLTVMTHAHLAARQAAAHPPSTTGRKGITKSEPRDRRRLILGSMGYVSMLLGLIGPVFGGRLSVMPPLHLSQTDFTPALFAKLATAGEVDSAFVFPQLATDISRDKDALQVARTLQHISFGGGPLSDEVRSRLTACTQLNDCWSTTETGVFAFQEPDRDASGHIVVESPGLNLHFEERRGGVFELCIIRAPRKQAQPFGWHQAVFDTFDDGRNKYATGDGFIKHATKPAHWLPVGRLDDMIILSLGHSVNPLPTEQACMRWPGVRSAIGFGHMKPALGLLVEMHPDYYQPLSCSQRLHDYVFMAVKDINARRQTFERVQARHIVLCSAEKPLSRSAKGLVQREACLKTYQEIDDCYSKSLVDHEFGEG
ncbi:nonribosomal peptide synthetase MxcG [Teratosphaeria destructans]|uniref:Nonribosomal peptide synthetase MxcG n=1 Tax=Teratosphaeria destructans TaxID=418781 RepID=A0A9W7W073_9PEZI|nr:nonribosomal peptide synthetase MxcG [Teratosphaeria destructans]